MGFLIYQKEKQRRGLSKHTGKTCALGHTERLARNVEYVISKRVSSSLRNAMKRGAYPVELTTNEKIKLQNFIGNQNG